MPGNIHVGGFNYGITVVKFFIWGCISSDIRSEILFYGDASADPHSNLLFNHKQTVVKFFIWGGISSDIRSEILFYGDASADPHSNLLFNHKHRKNALFYAKRERHQRRRTRR